MLSNLPTCADTACTDYIETGMNALGENVWNIYPNPNDGAFSLKINSTTAETVELKVMNAIGALIDKLVYEIQSGEQNFYTANRVLLRCLLYTTEN